MADVIQPMHYNRKAIIVAVVCDKQQEQNIAAGRKARRIYTASVAYHSRKLL